MAAEASGFIPGVKLPFWIRPSVKFRGLYHKVNPGGTDSSGGDSWIPMQRDFNLVLAADRDQKTVLVMNYGLLPEKMDFYHTGKPVNAVSRAHYIRFFPLKKVSTSIGLMDIAYGLRTEDHTAVNREGIGLDMNSQSHSVKVHYIDEDFEFSVQYFVGNLMMDKAFRLPGAAITTEYSMLENDRVGASVIQMKNDTNKYTRASIHNRWGLPDAHGSSVIAEIGLKQDETAGSATKAPWGTYGIFRGIVNLTRGYNIMSTIEREQDEIKFSAQETQRWTFGLLFFPWERTEMRLNTVQTKIFNPASAAHDEWDVQGQVHVSF
jgi:hypothetical protein